MQPRNTPQQALEILRMGNRRWVEDKLINPHRNPSRREVTALAGQRPLAAVLACSDSRVEPVVLFDQGLGDLFVVRVAGNVSGPDVVGSLAFAVFELAVPLVLVLGHTGCGAITAAMKAIKGAPLPPSTVGSLVDKLRPVAAEAHDADPDCEQGVAVDRAVYLNVAQVRRDILRASPVITEAVDEGRAVLAGAVYHLASGEVEWLDGAG